MQSLYKPPSTEPITILAVDSLVPRPRGRREKWPGIYMRQKPRDFMGYHIQSFTNLNLYRIAPKHVRVEQVSKSEDFDEALMFALCCIGKGDLTLKVRAAEEWL